MKVVLLKAIDNLGKFGDIATVAPGYARNYLIPKKFAVVANKTSIELIEKNKEELQKRHVKEMEEAEKRLELLSGKHIVFLVQASAKDDRLFGSVGISKIAEKISELVKCKIESSKIKLFSPIKYVGVYKIEVLLYPKIIAEVLLVVVRSESDVQPELDKFNTSSS